MFECTARVSSWKPTVTQIGGGCYMSRMTPVRNWLTEIGNEKIGNASVQDFCPVLNRATGDI